MKKNIDDPKLDKKLCAGCSYCCEYINIIIPKPRTKKALDKIIWYIWHGLSVHIHKGGVWTVHVDVKCKALNKNKECSIHAHRFNICRAYSQKKCKKYNPGKSSIIKLNNQKEFLAYCERYPELKALITKY